MTSSAITSGMLIFFGSVVVLIYGQQILIPFMFSLLIYFLIRYIIRYMNKVKVLREFVPGWLKSILSAGIIFTSLGLISKMIIYNFQYLINTMPLYQKNLERILFQVNDLLGIDLIKTLTENLNQLDYSNIANSVFNSISLLLGNALMIFFYVLFLVIEQSNFSKKLKLIFKGEQLREVGELLNDIEHSITQYIGLKTLISLMTGVISYFVLLAFGIKSAFFWAFLIFVLNYIPYVGSLIAVLLPFFFSLIQYGEFTTPLIMLLILEAIQIVIGNFIEPLIMGDSLNISPIVTLISLTFWGYLWGITGMFISVPLTVMLIIVLAKIPKTRSLAILLSHDGTI